GVESQTPQPCAIHQAGFQPPMRGRKLTYVRTLEPLVTVSATHGGSKSCVRGMRVYAVVLPPAARCSYPSSRPSSANIAFKLSLRTPPVVPQGHDYRTRAT